MRWPRLTPLFLLALAAALIPLSSAASGAPSGMTKQATGPIKALAMSGSRIAYDVGNATAPAFLGGNTEMDVVGSVGARGSVAYATAENGYHLGVYDVSDPTNVDLVDSRELAGQGFDVAGVKEQIGAEECSSRFFKQHAAIPAMRNMRR